MTLYNLEDDMHASRCGEFESMGAALEELRARAEIPWDKEPNRCPCSGWRNCVREYVVVIYDNSSIPWKELGRQYFLSVSAEGAQWRPVARCPVCGDYFDFDENPRLSVASSLVEVAPDARPGDPPPVPCAYCWDRILGGEIDPELLQTTSWVHERIAHLRQEE